MVDKKQSASGCSTDKGLSRDIVKAVDARRNWAVELLCCLVNAETTLGKEAVGQAIMADLMDGMGLVVDSFDVDVASIDGQRGFAPPVLDSYAGRPNVVGSHQPQFGTIGRSLILNGHIDVVPPADAALWMTQPFQAKVTKDKVFGRGAADMKAGLVANALSFVALRDLGYAPAAPVIFQSVIEEESGGNGTLACMARGYTADAVIIPEPFGQTILSAQMGVMWVTVIVKGRPAHVLDTSAGINAIDALFEIMQDLRALEEEWNRPEVRHPAYKDHRHPVNFNLGRIEGGDWPSTVPCSAWMCIRVGYFPGADSAAVQEEVEACVRRTARRSPRLAGAEVTFRYAGHRAEGHAGDTSAPLLQGLAAAHRCVTAGEPAYLASTATTDSRFYALYAETPATCYGPIGGELHGIDEWVSVQSMLQVGQVLAHFIADWCGLERTKPL
jgi:acetylornithine deacetylase